MEKLPNLVTSTGIMLLCFLVSSNGRSLPNRIYTFYSQNMSLKIKNENVMATKGGPSLYSLIKTKAYNQSTTDDVQFQFYLEATASGKLICMKRNGKVFSKDGKIKAKKNEKKRRQRRHNRRNKRDARVPKNCLFREFIFDHGSTYRVARGFYSAPHSNSSMGLFLSMSEEEGVGGIWVSYNTLNTEPHDTIKIELTPAMRHVNTFLNNTKFSKNLTKYDSRVRKCIKRRHTLFQNQDDEKKPRKKKSLKKVILKCKEIARKGKPNPNRRLEENININIIDVEEGESKVNPKLKLKPHLY